jgi:hypothetical protein
MKAYLVFKMDEPDDEMAHRRCVKAMDLCLAIHDFQDYLRFKHMDKEPNGMEIRAKFYEILTDKGIFIDDLIS